MLSPNTKKELEDFVETGILITLSMIIIIIAVVAHTCLHSN